MFMICRYVFMQVKTVTSNDCLTLYKLIAIQTIRPNSRPSQHCDIVYSVSQYKVHKRKRVTLDHNKSQKK